MYDGVPVPVPDYLYQRELVVEPLVVVAAPGRFAPRARPKLLSLAQDDWVMPPPDAACGQAVRVACHAAGFQPRVRWETDDMLLLVRAVAAGHGLAVLPRLAVADDVADVEIRPLAAPALQRRLVALTRSSNRDRPVVQAVLDQLR
jgi:DNA-binding transcriptional LysR family regulator